MKPQTFEIQFSHLPANGVPTGWRKNERMCVLTTGGIQRAIDVAKRGYHDVVVHQAVLRGRDVIVDEKGEP